MSATDKALYERWCATRDADAFAEIVSRHVGMVYSVCRRVLRNAAEAEDAAQECFIALMKARINVGDSLAPWLYSVAYRRAQDTRRKASRQHFSRPSASDNCTPSPDLETAEILGHVDAAINQLPENLRAPLVERFLSGRTHESIAREFGITESAVRYRLDKAVTRVREILKSRGVQSTSAVLLAVLGGKMSEAAPTAFVASMGKLAISGAYTSYTPIIQLIAEAIMAKKALAVVAFVVAAAVVGLSIKQGGKEEVRAPLTATISRPETKEPSPPPSKNIEPAKASVAPAQIVASTIELDHCEIPDASRYCSISGTVVDDTGSIVRDAEIIVVCQGYEDKEREQTKLEWCKRAMNKNHHFVAESDSAGKFEVTGIRYYGEAFVCARKDGRNSVNERVIFEEGSELSDIELKLGSEPKRIFRGRVLSSSNQPVNDAVVRLPGQRAGFAYTGGDGVFEMAMRTLKYDFICIYSPSAGMASFEVSLDETENIVDLKIPGPAVLVGKIEMKDSPSFADLRVRLVGGLAHWQTDETGNQTRTATAIDMSYEAEVAENGDYRIPDIDSGQFYFKVSVLNGAGISLSESELGYLSPNVDTVWNASLLEPVRVHGVVRSQKTNLPLTEGRIHVWAIQDDRVVNDVFIDRTGAYSMDLPAISAAYLICPSFDPFNYQGFDSYGELVVVAPGEEKEVDIKFMDTCTYPIRVVDEHEHPISTADVYRLQVDNEYKAGRTDKNGRFTCEGILPNFNALEIGVQLKVQKTGYCEGYTQRQVGEPGTMFPEEKIVLYRAANLRGTLQYSDGTPVVNRTITFTMGLSNGNSNWTSAYTRSDGTFELVDNVPATRISITLETYVRTGDKSRVITIPLPETTIAPGEILELGTLQLDSSNAESE